MPSYNTVWTEAVESRAANIGLSQPSATIEFVGYNSVAVDDDNDANLSLQGILLGAGYLTYPGTGYATLTYQSYQIKNIGGGVWRATVTYVRQNSLYAFEIGGGQQKITQSIQTTGRYGTGANVNITFTASGTSGSAVLNTIVMTTGTLAQITPGMIITGPGIPAGMAIIAAAYDSATDEVFISVPLTSNETSQTYSASGTIDAPNFKGAIGVDGNQVNGCEINVPVATWEETYYFPPGSITTAYEKLLNDNAWTVNIAAFRTRPAGSVLFMGARGSQRGIDNIEISFKFGYSPNLTSFTVGDVTVNSKLGWENLWILYQSTTDLNANYLVKIPRAAYTEQVYQYSDFTGLGIGS